MKNILLYLSAFIPMYVLILIKEIFELTIGDEKFTWLSVVVFCFLTLVIALGIIGLLLEVYNKKQKAIDIVILSKNNITDRHFLGYFSLFVLFAITFDLSRISMFAVFVVILSMIGIVYIKNNLFYINPFLNILGFNFYSIEYENETGEKGTTHIFCRGDIYLKKKYRVKIKDENFSFVSKQWNFNKFLYKNTQKCVFLFVISFKRVL